MSKPTTKVRTQTEIDAEVTKLNAILKSPTFLQKFAAPIPVIERIAKEMRMALRTQVAVLEEGYTQPLVVEMQENGEWSPGEYEEALSTLAWREGYDVIAPSKFWEGMY